MLLGLAMCTHITGGILMGRQALQVSAIQANVLEHGRGWHHQDIFTTMSISTTVFAFVMTSQCQQYQGLAIFFN